MYGSLQCLMQFTSSVAFSPIHACSSLRTHLSEKDCIYRVKMPVVRLHRIFYNAKGGHAKTCSSKSTYNICIVLVSLKYNHFNILLNIAMNDYIFVS